MISFKELVFDFFDKISLFFTFLIDKLKIFNKLSLAEQVGFCSTGFGLLLIIVSIILFIV